MALNWVVPAQVSSNKILHKFVDIEILPSSFTFSYKFRWSLRTFWKIGWFLGTKEPPLTAALHWVTGYGGLEPHQSCDTKRCMADISVMLRPKFFHQFTTDLWSTSGENFVKVSWMVLELLLILFKLTVYLWPPYAHPMYKVDIGWP